MPRSTPTKATTSKKPGKRQSPTMPKPTASTEAAGFAFDQSSADLSANAEHQQNDASQLDSLFAHLSCSHGLFSKETFMSLYGCITKMVRDQHQQMDGFVMTRTLDDAAFDSMTQALTHLPNIPLYAIQQAPSELNPRMGFLLVLTNRLCAALYWSSDTQEAFQLFEGGWTFHPGDSRTLANYVIERLNMGEAEIQTLKTHLDNTAVDRRYDDKLNLLVTALVNGLENRNRQLTVALNQVKHLNHQVVQSERLAAIGQLSSVIAHEIRNPLGLIDLYAKLIETQLEPLNSPTPQPLGQEQIDRLLKNLSQIRQATSGLETILSELTNYARPLTLDLQSIELTQLVHDVCEFYQPSYHEKSVILSFPDPTATAAAHYPLNLDRDRVRQALINLLKNALEASKSETEVIVSIVSRRGGNDQIYIKVSDQGCGISAEAAKKLFTPYFSTKKTGTGLGLAHSRKILQAHGGDVELISSYPDKGSTFAIILPQAKAPLG